MVGSLRGLFITYSKKLCIVRKMQAMVALLVLSNDIFDIS